MSEATSGTTRTFSTPYLTVAEYKQAPTAIDYTNIVVGSTDPAVQDAELMNVIARASSWIDTYCNQVLGATLDKENMRARMSNDGTIRVHPRFNPIVAVESFSFGMQPTSISSYPDCSSIWIEDQTFIVPYWTTQLSYSSQGALQFGLPSSPRQPVYCSYSYVNGYPSTLLVNGVNAGATSITVVSSIGLIAGTMLTIYDGLATENVVVADSYEYGSTTVPLVSPTMYAHIAGVAVSALPPAVKEAAILATTALLKIRGDSGMVMAVSNTPSGQSGESQRIGHDLSVAQDLLKPFRRIR